MPSERAAVLSLKVKKWIAASERMSLLQIMALSIRMVREAIKGDMTAKQAHALDRALGKRINSIDEDLKSGRISPEAHLEREKRAATIPYYRVRPRRSATLHRHAG